jgi:hypothetical protein
LDAWLELGAEEIAGAEEARFDGACGQVETAGGGGDIHLLKVIEEEDLAVFWRQGFDGFVEGGAFVVMFELLESASVEGAGVGGIGDLFEGEGDGRDAADLGAVEVGGKREEPGGEGGLLPPGGEVAEGAEEGLLGHVFGARAVAAEAVGEVDERRLPAADDALEGVGVAGEDMGYVALVFCWVQAALCLMSSVTGEGRVWLRFLFVWG